MNGMVSRPRHGLSLCAGGGGLDLGLMLAEPGFHTRAFVEWEGYHRTVLIASQRAGYFALAPSGTTCAVSMPGPSAVPSTSSSPDIRVSPSALPESAVVPMTLGPSGRTSPGLSGSASPNGSSSKTSPVTSPSVLNPCCESFGAWATRLRRACSARQKLARRTSGFASSSWPTPMSLHPGTTATTRPGTATSPARRKRWHGASPTYRPPRRRMVRGSGPPAENPDRDFGAREDVTGAVCDG